MDALLSELFVVRTNDITYCDESRRLRLLASDGSCLKLKPSIFQRLQSLVLVADT